MRQDRTVFQWYWRSLQALVVPDGVTVDFMFVDDNEEPGLAEALDGLATVLPATPRPPGAKYSVGPNTHEWAEATFDHLALQKQRILDHALNNGYTHVMMVDSDLLLSPTTLVSLLATGQPIVNAVFWTRWQPKAQPMPQVWTKNPYEFTGHGMTPPEFMAKLHDHQLVRVEGGGACVLISIEALAAGVRYFPRLTDLPSHNMWQGEDRTFAVLAQRLHFPQHADAWPVIYHAYGPADRTPKAMEAGWATTRTNEAVGPDVGDWVSLRLQHLQLTDPVAPTVENLRLRLGTRSMLPELETAIRGLSPGEERFVQLTYPPHWPYRPGATAEILVSLIDWRV